MLGESLYILGKYLDYKESKKDKEHLKSLEKSIDIEKAFSKGKDKQINKALMKGREGWLGGSGEF